MRFSISALSCVKVLSVVLSATALSGCGGSTPPDFDVPSPVHYVTAYMPFVEDVIFPDPIYSGEEFYVTLKLSSALKPDLLRGDLYKQLIASGGTYPWEGGWLDGVMTPWIRPQDEFAGPPTDELVHWMLPLPAGERKIGVQSAKTRELGGLSAQYEIGTGGGAFSEDVDMRIFMVTVIERPGT